MSEGPTIPCPPDCPLCAADAAMLAHTRVCPTCADDNEVFGPCAEWDRLEAAQQVAVRTLFPEEDA